MRRMLHLLIVLTMLWCGLHSDFAAQAHEGAADQHRIEADLRIAPEDMGQAHGGSSGTAHVGHHHHCPVAPDHSPDPFRCDVAEGEELFAWAETPDLISRSQAPPLQPPAA